MLENLLNNYKILNNLDKDYRSNYKYVTDNNLLQSLNYKYLETNLKRVIFLSGLGFFLSLYVAIMDYITHYSSSNELSLSLYRIIDPVFAIFSIFINILSRYAKTSRNEKFMKTIVYIFLFGTVANYSMVSSIEQFDFHYHPSFVFAMFTMAILLTIKPVVQVSLYIMGIVIIRFFCTFFPFEGNMDNISYSVTIFILPITIASSEIMYKNSFRTFADKHKLESVNQTLEVKINKRTAELKEKNEELTSQLELQKQYEETLEVAKDKAERSDRLKSAFLTNLSHEIRTPLNSIIGFSSLLGKSTIGPEKTKRYTELISSCGKELVYIIDQLVEMSRIESGEVEVNKLYFMVNDLLFEIQETALERLRELKKEHISFSIKNPCYERNIRLYSDLIKIKHVLNNLIDNAIKFTEKGKIEIGFNQNTSSSIVFYVEDTGIGISEKDKEILFDQFSQGHSGISRRYGGLGIGLSISKNYSDILGGKLSFESEEGKGTKFIFTIPIT